MYRTIKKIHEKSDRQRKRLATGWTIAITSVIALIWGITLPGQFDNNIAALDSASANVASVDGQELEIQKPRTPLGVFKESVKNSINFARDRSSAAAIDATPVPATDDLETASSESTPETEVEVLKVESREGRRNSETSPRTNSEELDFLPESSAKLEFLP
jgi:hypothetical protein